MTSGQDISVMAKGKSDPDRFPGPSPEMISQRALICEETTRLCVERVGMGLQAIVLTGSLARNEATFVPEDLGWQLLGDADFFLVYDREALMPSDDSLHSLGSTIQDRLLTQGIRVKIGLGTASPEYFQKLSRRIATYELRTCGAVVWGNRNVLSLIPAFDSTQVSREDAWRMLCNRMIEFLAPVQMMSPQAKQLDPLLRYSTVKLLMDSATSYLLFAGAYEPSFRARAERLRALAADLTSISPSGIDLKAFSESTWRCSRWKLSGRPEDYDSSPALLEEAVHYARCLWRWELEQLTSAPVGECSRALWDRWARQQTFSQRARGWLSLFRRSGLPRSSRRWPRWLAQSFRATPRYWIYLVAGELFWRLPFGIEREGAPPGLDANWSELHSLLPDHDAHASKQNDEWRNLAADVTRNYNQFLMGTEA